MSDLLELGKGSGSAWTLHFYASQLNGSAFWNESTRQTYVCIRGRTSGALQSQGSFCWTSGAQGLAILALKYRLAGLASTAEGNSKSALLSGGRGSKAASLDFALSKQSIWVQEMFGLDFSGRLYARQLILRTNPERKLPGPVVLAINPRILAAERLHIFKDDRKLEMVEELQELLRSVETGDSQPENEKDHFAGARFLNLAYKVA